VAARLFKRQERRKEERRTGERRKKQLPFDGPDRRRGKDRRQYVRRVMSGQEPLPQEERGGPH
jgi:hypothetical protein